MYCFKEIKMKRQVKDILGKITIRCVQRMVFNSTIDNVLFQLDYPK